MIAVDISDKKLEKAKELGATHTVNGLKENVPEKIKVNDYPPSSSLFFLVGGLIKNKTKPET